MISDERAILSTSNGVIVLAFMNLKERANWDWQEEISDSPGARLPTYTVRSLDGGKTWQDVQKLHNEWTGAIRDMIETENGNIVFTSMMMWHHPGHHTVLTYKSGNEGKTWERSNIIDLGGIGHHSGVTEATLESLPQGKLWLLMRTNWGTFWEAFSTDDGKHGMVSGQQIYLQVLLPVCLKGLKVAGWFWCGIGDSRKARIITR